MRGKTKVVMNVLLVLLWISGVTLGNFATSFEEAEGYTKGTVDGQQGWSITIGGLSRAKVTDWWQAPSDGTQALNVNAYDGTGRATHSIDEAPQFEVSVTMAWNDSAAGYAVMDLLGNSHDPNVDPKWAGIRCGFTRDENGVMKFSYRDGSTVRYLPLENGASDPAKATHYRFVVTVYSNTSSYDLSVFTLDNILVGSVASASARAGTDIFNSINFTIEADLDTKHTMYVDNIKVTSVPEPATLGLLIIGGFLGIYPKK